MQTKKKLKILHLTGEYPPYFIGGLGTYIYEICKNQYNRGHEIEVLLIKGNDSAYKQELLSSSEDIDVTVRDFDYRGFSKYCDGVFNVSDIEHEFNVLKSISRIPDIVHVHDWYGVLWGCVLKRNYNIPLVMTAHLPLRSGFTYTGHPIPTKIKMRLEALGFRLADMIIAPTNFIARVLMSEYNVFDEKIQIVPNGIDTQYFSPNGNENKNEKIVLSVSRITEQKGVEFLPELAQSVINKIPQVKFLIVGEGPILNKLENISKTLSISDNIEFSGFIPRNKLLELYRQAEIFVSTSIYEPFGLVNLEAMASGNPVVAFSIGGIKEVVRNNMDGFLVPPWSVDLLSESIIKLLSNSKLRLEYGNNARKRALEFDWKNVTSQLDDAYKHTTVKI